MSVEQLEETLPQPALTQPWETSPRPDEFALAQHLAELAVKTEAQPEVPPQRRPRRREAAMVLPLLVQVSPNLYIDSDSNTFDNMKAVRQERAGLVRLQNLQTPGEDDARA